MLNSKTFKMDPELIAATDKADLEWTRGSHYKGEAIPGDAPIDLKIDLPSLEKSSESYFSRHPIDLRGYETIAAQQPR